MSAQPRVALTIAGSDSGGGAGIQADLKTFSSLGVYGASVITAVTAQNTIGVQGVMVVPPDFVAAQLRSVLTDMPVSAIKIGMVPTAEHVSVIATELANYPHIRVVLDPVMVATSGDSLVAGDIAAGFAALQPVVDLITPNLAESACLCGTAMAGDVAEVDSQAQALVTAGWQRALVKGGHLTGDAIDVLATADEAIHIAGQRITTNNTHGTGCSLSSAIAAYLALGQEPVSAVRLAKTWLTGALAAATDWQLGHGHGPVDHFHNLRS